MSLFSKHLANPLRQGHKKTKKERNDGAIRVHGGDVHCIHDMAYQPAALAQLADDELIFVWFRIEKERHRRGENYRGYHSNDSDNGANDSSNHSNYTPRGNVSKVYCYSKIDNHVSVMTH